MTLRHALFATALFAAAAAATPASAALDVVEAPTGFFVPTDAQKYDSPYYREFGEGWGWTHGALTAPTLSATLSISAFDVDFPAEQDIISAYDTDSSSWISLGALTGATDAWAFTDFVLPSSLYNEIASGLQVKMDIDINNDGWLVTLSKSALCTDNDCTLPTPDPSVPEPATLTVLGMGLLGLAAARRRRNRA